MTARPIRASAVASLVLALAACTGGTTPAPGDVPSMYVAEIDNILAGSPSDLEERVLADYRVTDAEITEARDAFATCVRELPYGFVLELAADGGYEISGLEDFYATFATEDEAAKAFDDVVVGCEEGTTLNLGPLYAQMRDNPEGKTYVELVRECFARHDVPDGDGLTDDQLSELLESPAQEPSGPWATSCRLDPQSDELVEEPGDAVEIGTGSD